MDRDTMQQLLADLATKSWIELPEGWLQGRTVFGGLTSLMMLHQAERAVNDPNKQLLSCSISFVAPVQAQPVKVTVEILRQGKSVTVVEARLWQDNAVMSVLLAHFGAKRDSHLNIQQQRVAPDYPAPEQLTILPYHPLMPQCYQNFDLVWAEGAYPCAASPQPDFGGWFRYQEKFGTGMLSMPEFIGLIDIWPAGVFSTLTTPAPGSSVSWSVTLLREIRYNRLDWFKYKVFTDYAEHGYATEYAHIWDQNDCLVAISRQTVAVFA